MTGNYLATLGTNIALGSLTYIMPIAAHIDPTSPGLKYDVLPSISGIDVPQGLAFTEWRWKVLAYDEFEDLMIVLGGLSPTAPTKDITIVTLGTTTNYVRMNAKAHYPFEGVGYVKEQGYMKDVTIRLDRMYAAT